VECDSSQPVSVTHRCDNDEHQPRTDCAPPRFQARQKKVMPEGMRRVERHLVMSNLVWVASLAKLPLKLPYDKSFQKSKQ
jgi:hypothetical protein